MASNGKGGRRNPNVSSGRQMGQMIKLNASDTRRTTGYKGRY